MTRIFLRISERPSQGVLESASLEVELETRILVQLV